MDSAAAAKRHPVLNERGVSGTAEGRVSRAGINRMEASGSVMPAVCVTCNDIGLNDELAVFVVPHMLSVNADLNVCTSHILAEDLAVHGQSTVDCSTCYAVLLCNIHRIYAEPKLFAGRKSGRSELVRLCAAELCALCRVSACVAVYIVACSVLVIVPNEVDS